MSTESAISDTKYPRLDDDVSQMELDQVFTPTAKDKAWLKEQKSLRRPESKVCAMVQLKVMKRLGYSLPLRDVPLAVLAHISRKLKLSRPSKEWLQRYQHSAELTRHRTMALDVLDMRDPDAAARRWMAARAEAAAASTQELPDIINVLLEEIAAERYTLPGFTVLDRIARAAREKVNQALYDQVFAALDDSRRHRLDALLGLKDGKTDWDRLKREPKRPTAKEVASFLLHIRWLAFHAKGLPELEGATAAKREKMTEEAQSLDAARMKLLTPPKRYTMAVLLITASLRQATDDVASIFVRSMRKLDTDAQRRLTEYRMANAAQVERLLGQLLDILVAYDKEVTDDKRGAAVGGSLIDVPQQLIDECKEHLAFQDNNYLPFMLKPYEKKRALVYECLEVLQPMPTYNDAAFGRCLMWVLENRQSHKELLPPVLKGGGDELDLGWLPEKWRKQIVSKDADGTTLVNRKYLEMAVFMRVYTELKTGDLFVPHSDEYDDYRTHLMAEEQFAEEMPRFAAEMELETDGAAFVARLRSEFVAQTDTIDADFPKNDSVAWGPLGLIIRKVDSIEPPADLPELDKAINDALGQHSIIDVLTETEKWLNLHRLFRPLSGYDTKIVDPRGRFIGSLFCYGCNIGATQTARSLKGLSRKQVAWINLNYVTEERLERANKLVINAYNRFALPRFWGTGKRVAVDGTKVATYEDNLMSEYHIRYQGYGAIGYYHVSDTYIALFSKLIPCGAYEAIHLLDKLITNETDIKPDTVHGDTQAQSTPVFALSSMLGISLMPRIRNIRDLTFYKPTKDTVFQNIEPLFGSGRSIDWDLIERHYEEMMRVVVSIKEGMLTASALLRRLGTGSKSKLYFAFRELGRVVRTMFLLRYISEPDLRRTINAETNKVEEFHQFCDWVFFGNDGMLEENSRFEQSKVMKWNHLVANMLMLNTVHRMTRALKDMQEKGAFNITETHLARLSPYRYTHINKYGDYILDLQRPVEPMHTRIKFSFKERAARAAA